MPAPSAQLTPQKQSHNHLVIPGLTRNLFRLFFCLTIFYFLANHPNPALAENLFSPSFNIQMSTINLTGGNKDSANFHLTDTVGQTIQGRFDSAGYTIKAGFQYIYSSTPFTFKISNLALNFGSLSAGIPSVQSNVLTVTTGSAFGYVVRAVQDHPLKLLNGTSTIPNTACNVATPCTPYDATAWTENNRYGLGYNMSGTDIDATDFTGSTFFRPFSTENIDAPATVMSKNSMATSSAATVTYKVIIPGSQASGTYQNGIQYIAIPSF